MSSISCARSRTAAAWSRPRSASFGSVMRARASSASVESDDTLGPLLPHDLTGKPVPTFPDHALEFPEVAADRRAQAFLARRSLGRVITGRLLGLQDRKSTRLNSSHSQISYAVFCLKKKKHKHTLTNYPES